METQNLEALRFPVGKFIAPKSFEAGRVQAEIQTLSGFGNVLAEECKLLNNSKLDKAYRPGGWNAVQLIHHLADSHMNSFIRFKLALTEDNPSIKTYHEDLWAELTDAKDLPFEISLKILEGLHARWAVLLKNMQPADFSRTFFHPEFKKDVPLFSMTALYDWHCRHHLAHLQLITRV